MSTNYYFQVKKIDLLMNKIKQLSPFITDDMLTRLKWRLKDIHIGKRSGGWKPIFEKTSYYSTIKELEKFYNNNKDNLIIKSEYEEEMTWDRLKEELIDWMPEGKSSLQDSVKEGYYRENEYYQDEDGYEWTTHEFS